MYVHKTLVEMNDKELRILRGGFPIGHYIRESKLIVEIPLLWLVNLPSVTLFVKQ